MNAAPAARMEYLHDLHDLVSRRKAHRLTCFATQRLSRSREEEEKWIVIQTNSPIAMITINRVQDIPQMSMSASTVVDDRGTNDLYIIPAIHFFRETADGN